MNPGRAGPEVGEGKESEREELTGKLRKTTSHPLKVKRLRKEKEILLAERRKCERVLAQIWSQ